MSEFAALALYPAWAVAVLVGATALRLGRETGRGLVALCLCLAAWVTGLILVASPGAGVGAGRVLPAGMLLAGGFVHAGADVLGLTRRGWVWAAYGWGAGVAMLGALAPRMLYSDDVRRPGALFYPLAAASVAGTAFVLAWLARGALAAAAPGERRRRGALALACALGSLGGGGAIGARVIGLADVEFAAPLLAASVALAGYAVLSGEHGRSRRIFARAIGYAVITAAMSCVGLVAFYRLLPRLAPGGGRSVAWLVVVTFVAALPLDALRMLVVESVGRRLFRDPIGVRDLADEAERSEARADHAERLAEIGAVVSAVAHEIRNPLGVIAAQAKLLERAGAPEASVAALREQVERARRFVDDLLRYGKPRPLDVRAVEVFPALELAAGAVRQSMGDSAPRIEVLRGDAGELAVEADRGALNDVVTALVHNAAIAVEGREGSAGVRVTAGRDAAGVWVAVEDDGPGVPREIEAELFAPFVTGRGRDARHPGTGLGLAIAARWVERHGGSIRHERPASGGARFVVRWSPGGGAARGV